MLYLLNHADTEDTERDKITGQESKELYTETHGENTEFHRVFLLSLCVLSVSLCVGASALS